MATHTYLAVILAMLATVSQSHMIMKTPVPYGHPNNSPLDPSGSDYPCKFNQPMTVTTMNAMPAGSSQILSFTGSATHGGGSCQVSLTMDKTPSKSSLFKVIHSIEGGCPASAAGNLGNDPDSSATPKFNFTMPKDMPSGTYSLAWTWFNEIGNREMYMNCAPVTVTGGAPNDDAWKKLPDMFVGNEVKAKNGVYDNSNAQCVLKESTDVAFPEPGKSVQRIGTKQAPPPAACMPKGKSGDSSASSPPAPDSDSGSNSGSGYAGPPKAGGSDSSPPPPMADTSSSAPPAGPAAPAPSATVVASSPPTPAASPVAAPVAAPEPAPVSGGSAGACAAGSVPCTGAGSVMCIGSSQFGLCNTNGCAMPQALAAGTRCNGGKIMKRSVYSGAGLHRGGKARHVHAKRRAMPGWGVGGGYSGNGEEVVGEVELGKEELIMG